MQEINCLENEAGLEGFEKRVTSPPLFREALGAGFDALPGPVKALHDGRVRKRFKGKGRVERSYGLLLNLIAACLRLPRAGENLDIEVSIKRGENQEIWERTFEGRKFSSIVSRAAGTIPGRITETFGPLSFDIDLDNRLGRLYYPVGRARIGALRLPRILTPRSDTVEHLTATDQYHFSVKIELPLLGHLITYEGWLEDAQPPISASAIA